MIARVFHPNFRTIAIRVSEIYFLDIIQFVIILLIVLIWMAECLFRCLTGQFINVNLDGPRLDAYGEHLGVPNTSRLYDWPMIIWYSSIYFIAFEFVLTGENVWGKEINRVIVNSYFKDNFWHESQYVSVLSSRRHKRDRFHLPRYPLWILYEPKIISCFSQYSTLISLFHWIESVANRTESQIDANYENSWT